MRQRSEQMSAGAKSPSTVTLGVRQRSRSVPPKSTLLLPGVENRSFELPVPVYTIEIDDGSSAVKEQQEVGDTTQEERQNNCHYFVLFFDPCCSCDLSPKRFKHSVFLHDKVIMSYEVLVLKVVKVIIRV